MAGSLAERLENIRRLGGIKSRDVAQILSTTPETVSRWQTGRVEPRRTHLDQVLLLEYLIGELSAYFAPEHARLWLFAPHPLLAGERPAELLRDGKYEEVRSVIESLRTGAYI